MERGFAWEWLAHLASAVSMKVAPSSRHAWKASAAPSLPKPAPWASQYNDRSPQDHAPIPTLLTMRPLLPSSTSSLATATGLADAVLEAALVGARRRPAKRMSGCSGDERSVAQGALSGASHHSRAMCGGEELAEITRRRRLQAALRSQRCPHCSRLLDIDGEGAPQPVRRARADSALEWVREKVNARTVADIACN